MTGKPRTVRWNDNAAKSVAANTALDKSPLPSFDRPSILRPWQAWFMFGVSSIRREYATFHEMMLDYDHHSRNGAEVKRYFPDGSPFFEVVK